LKCVPDMTKSAFRNVHHEPKWRAQKQAFSLGRIKKKQPNTKRPNSVHTAKRGK